VGGHAIGSGGQATFFFYRNDSAISFQSSPGTEP